MKNAVKTMVKIILLTAFVVGLMTATRLLFASEPINVSVLADSIRLAEGNKNYGVLSIPCKTEEKCRQICINSIKNNLKRYQTSDKSVYFITFIGKRCAPVGMGLGSNDPKNLNANWVKNTSFFYAKLLKSNGAIKSFTKCKAHNIKRVVS